MTVQATDLDLDALVPAARAVISHLGAMGVLEARALGPESRSGDELFGGTALSVDVGGAHPGQVGLVVGTEAEEAVVGTDLPDPEEEDDDAVVALWEPVMAAIVVALTDHAGDLEPQDVQVLAPGSSYGPALDPEAISVGIFRGDHLVAAVGFVAGQQSGTAPARAGVTAGPASRAADAVVGSPRSEAGPASPAGQGAPAAAAHAHRPAAPGSPVPPVAPVFGALVGAEALAVDARRMNLLRDVEMGVSVELGRTRMTVRDLLSLAPGMIVELDRPAGAPVDLLVNGTLMARGEVVVIDEEFAVRISQIVDPEQEGRLGA